MELFLSIIDVSEFEKKLAFNQTTRGKEKKTFQCGFDAVYLQTCNTIR